MQTSEIVMANIYKFNNSSFNSQTRELVIQYKSVYLRRKVAAVLTILLENKHRIVEREEFLTTIWREGSMRENSLLQCIRELRQILGDSAAHPKYIKTYHTNGYQWFDTGTTIVEAHIDTGINTSTDIQNANLIVDNPAKPVQAKKLRFTFLPKKLKPSRLLITGFALSIFASSYHVIFNTNIINQGSSNHDSIILVVKPISNLTGDKSLQWVQLGLSDMVMSVLAQSAHIRIIPMHVVQQALSEQSPKNSNKDLLLTLKADYLIQSNITKSNLKTYDFNYQVINHSGIVNSKTFPTSDIIAAIPTIVRQFSTQLLPVNNDLITLLTLSSNNQANRDYGNGIQALKTKGPPLAKRHFEAALINDPDFIWAKAQLALVLSKLGEWKKAKTQFREMLHQEKVNSDLILKSFINLALANIYLDQSQLTQAEKLFNTVIVLSDTNKNDYSKVDALWGLSKIAEYRSHWQTQNSRAQQAIALSRNSNELRIKANNLYYLGSPSNSRLENNETINMQQNRDRLEKALNYYSKLMDVESQAKTLLSMGANYTFDFKQRIDFLNEASKLFKQLGNKMQLVNTLSYTGYLYIQYHLGDKALFPLQTSYQMAKSIGAVQSELLNHYLLAFAALDQGTNHKNSKEKTQYLNIAAQQFINLQNDSRLKKDSQLYADSTLLLAWTVSEQGEHTRAINYIKQSERIYLALNLTTSISYSTMSLVREHVAMQNWKQALQFINRPHQNKRTRQYFARSYYELKQYNKALAMAELNKSTSNTNWTQQDDARLIRYRLVNSSNQYQQLPPEASAHTTYCEPLPENT